MPCVLLVFPVNEVGGGETVLLNLVRFRERRDLEYRALIVSDADGPLTQQLADLGVLAARVPRGRMSNPLALMPALSAIGGEIERVRPDAILANSSQGYLYARWGARTRLPIALYFMSVPQPALWRNSPLDIFARCSPPDVMFAASNAIRGALEGLGFPNVSTVYHGAPEPASTADQRAALTRRLAQLGMPAGAPIVLMPGRLQRWKGQLVFVRAFAEVARQLPDVHGVCLGGTLFGREAGFQQELLAEIRQLGLAGRLHLPGQDAIGPWLERAACVVHASIEPDAFPNVCIEALASHRPLITNTACGVAEILQHGRDAWVVAPADVSALSGAMAEVLRDSDDSARVAEQGYLRYVETCTPSHMVVPIEQALTRIGRSVGA